MAGTVNKVILIGNLGKDPEVRVLENKTKLVRFTIATSESYTDKTTGELKKITDWHNVVVWRGLAEIAEKYLTKGQKVYVEGKIKTRTWRDDTNTVRNTTDIVADNMIMLSKPDDKNTPHKPDFNTGDTPQKPDSFNSDLLEDSDDDGLPF